MTPPPSPARPRSVAILGATGSVGGSTLALLDEQPELFRLEAVTASTSGTRLAAIARRYRARFAAVADPAAYAELRDALAGSGIEAAAGQEALAEAARRDADLVVAAIVGAAGLVPVLAAIRRGAMVALANKECLVCAGTILMRELARSGARLLPVDSEHSAIFQVLTGNRREDVERLTLTASGGPFRCAGTDEMERATPAQAIRHPVWSMGAKISVDSATMMNKGLEIIEAHHLFAMPEERIEVVIHPQSVVHSLVTFKDGSTLAQLGEPDMRVPIAYALAWPTRMSSSSPRLDLGRAMRLDFEPPDLRRFPALSLARLALRQGGAAPTILNAANEVAVAAFIAGRIGFLDIARVVESVLGSCAFLPLESLGEVVEQDRMARAAAAGQVAALAARSAPHTRHEASA
ncbi:MAG TPA: 1-deoxy-D-xylulose-5-phosphate reductoisomerase [Geminicoccaceae bacterium]|nr:1-deoxy-D-xylulose-5-phosphate reductoisomerase [Geminicoccus sp.]HMU49235.1 1-deoxy-D-xylulose-5-phosphate reductoisomerase [Geminicoccaceae bacterium]